MRALGTFFVLLVTAAQMHAQMPPPQCGPMIIGTGPNITVTRSDSCGARLPPPPPSPWPIIKLIAQTPDSSVLEWLLKGPFRTGPKSNGVGHSDCGTNPTNVRR
jgi:hypothetical protein